MVNGMGSCNPMANNHVQQSQPVNGGGNGGNGGNNVGQSMAMIGQFLQIMMQLIQLIGGGQQQGSQNNSTFMMPNSFAPTPGADLGTTQFSALDNNAGSFGGLQSIVNMLGNILNSVSSSVGNTGGQSQFGGSTPVFTGGDNGNIGGGATGAGNGGLAGGVNASNSPGGTTVAAGNGGGAATVGGSSGGASVGGNGAAANTIINGDNNTVINIAVNGGTVAVNNGNGGDTGVTDPDCDPTPTQPQEPSGFETTTQGRIWGDPHFVGAEGGQYDVQGTPGTTYNLLSDRGLQMNGTFDQPRGNGATVMTDVGFTIGQDQVHADADGDLTINGEVVTEDGTYLNGALEKAGNQITVNTPEFEIGLTDQGAHFDATFDTADALTDGVAPHGLWGQTVDGDGEARNGDKGGGAQGGGAIEGANGITERGDKTSVELYEVNGLFDTNFQNFNRYHQ